MNKKVILWYRLADVLWAIGSFLSAPGKPFNSLGNKCRAKAYFLQYGKEYGT